MAFQKGYDPGRNTEQTFRKGDGKKRGLFVKGDDPRRLPNERLQEVNFKPGHTYGANEDGPKTSPDARADLIPMQFQVEVSPSTTGVDLLPMLNDAIVFGERMMGLIVSGPRVVIEEEVLGDEEQTDAPETQEGVTRKHLASRASVDNALAVGLYTELLTKCIKTRAEIEGGGLKPAMFGKLSNASVEQVKDELAYLLQCNLTKLNHGLHYANGHDIFDKNGAVSTWASVGMRALLSGIRTAIETRARLDVWERRQNKEDNSILVLYREVLNETE